MTLTSFEIFFAPPLQLPPRCNTFCVCVRKTQVDDLRVIKEKKAVESSFLLVISLVLFGILALDFRRSFPPPPPFWRRAPPKWKAHLVAGLGTSSIRAGKRVYEPPWNLGLLFSCRRYPLAPRLCMCVCGSQLVYVRLLHGRKCAASLRMMCVHMTTFTSS